MSHQPKMTKHCMLWGFLHFSFVQALTALLQRLLTSIPETIHLSKRYDSMQGSLCPGNRQVIETQVSVGNQISRVVLLHYPYSNSRTKYRHMFINQCSYSCILRFLEPTWDDAKSEMLLEVNCLTQSERQQRLADLPAWDGINCPIDGWTDVSAVQGWFNRERAVSLARDSPLQAKASGNDLARIVMMLSRVSVSPKCGMSLLICLHIWCNKNKLL